MIDTAIGATRDAHLHLLPLGEELTCPDVSGCATLGACLEAVSRVAAGAEDGAWIVLRGARAEGWAERRLPTARELDDAGSGAAVVVRSFDHHGAAVSGEGLARAGLAGGPPAGMPPAFLPMGEDGRPAGLALESAYAAVLGAIRLPGSPREHLLRALDELTRFGIVEAHDMAATPGLIDELFVVDDAGRLPIDVTVYARPEHLPEVRARFGRGRVRGRVTLGGLKLFLDGTLNARTAWMLEPYARPAEAHPRGVRLIDDDELDAHFGRAQEIGDGIATHAIGDAAVRQALDAYDRLSRRAGGRPVPLRVEHAQFIDEDDVPRFAALGAVASLQPAHLLTDVEAVRRHAPAREGRAFALADLIGAYERVGLDPRAHVLLGTDAPIVSADPSATLRGAVDRARAAGDHEPIAPGQAIERGVCLSLMRPGASAEGDAA